MINHNGYLRLASGELFHGVSVGAESCAVGEACFATGMTGYQETLTDPSFARQIVTFCFPHIGNVGCNQQDMERDHPAAVGAIFTTTPTSPSSWRAEESLGDWLKKHKMPGLAGIDTRKLTIRLREKGFVSARICCDGRPPDETQDMTEIKRFGSLDNMELAESVWSKNSHTHGNDFIRPHIIVIDYGTKENIIVELVKRKTRVTVLPGNTTAAKLEALSPDGVVLSNGPGDPLATYQRYARHLLPGLISGNVPVLAVCLGFQLLALAFGGKRIKLRFGHRGINHPVRNLISGRVEITSQNHGFAIQAEGLPESCYPTHLSLFDGTLEGFRVHHKAITAVQFHPEASPGPHDTNYLFNDFVNDVVEQTRSE